MGIAFSTKIEEGILHVHASGYDESLEDVQRYAAGVLQQCVEGGVRFILCDETELEYRLGTFDLYELGKFFSSFVPRDIRVAIVCSPEVISDTVFFENVVVNRGHCLKLFRETDMAKRWLLSAGFDGETGN
ncbi:MAG: hypothetical protein HGB20_09455 [Chlorobiaceae bacterium]|nr:hypothetical protein [Chlorobiaceae bacterium]